MNWNTRLSAALHALLHLARQDGPMTSEALATCLHTNPVVVRRTLSGLRKAGLVDAQRGRGGGWSLAASLDAITLRDVHEAVGSPPLLAAAPRQQPPTCLVAQAVDAALDPAFADAQALLLARFGAVTLAQLAVDIDRRLAHHPHARGHGHGHTPS